MALARRVRPDSFVDVIAPSSPFDEEQFRKSLISLEQAGFRPRYRPDIFSRTGFLAGDDRRRTDELLAAIDAPDSDVIWCARGGSGAARVLSELTLGRVSRANKILVGFSDISVLHCLWLAAGVPSVHGSMVARFGTEPADVVERLVRLVKTGEAPAPLTGHTVIRGVSEGVLSGGNLMVLSCLCGTPYQPDFTGAIVFLEDVGERPYRLDRTLVQCEQSGVFDGVAGIALGDFTDCEQPGTTSASVLAEHVSRLNVPCIRGLPCGHGPINQAMPFGVRARLDATAGRLEFLEPIHEAAGHVRSSLT